MLKNSDSRMRNVICVLHLATELVLSVFTFHKHTDIPANCPTSHKPVTRDCFVSLGCLVFRTLTDKAYSPVEPPEICEGYNLLTTGGLGLSPLLTSGLNPRPHLL